ncbi:MAG: hypothetical protein ACM3XM_17855 [Mycobacterium leprae]
MKRLALCLAVLLLAGCTSGGTKLAATSSGTQSSADARPVPLAQAAPQLGSAEQVARAALPTTELKADRLQFRLPPVSIKGFYPQLMLSPDGTRVAFTYETPAGPLGKPMVAAAALTLAHPVKQQILAWALNPTASDRTAPGLKLVGWVDDRQVLFLRATTTQPGALDMPAQSVLRTELVDVTDGSVTAGPWFAMGSYRGWGLDDLQAWLTEDRHVLAVNTGDLWRIDLPDGTPKRIHAAVPESKEGGPALQIGPDGWTAFYGGASRGVVDLRTGKDSAMPDSWKQTALSHDGRLAVLLNEPNRPGARYSGAEGDWQFYSALVVARPEGAILNRIAVPEGWLVAGAQWTPEGDSLLFTAVQLVADPANQLSKNRMAREALFLAPLDGSAPELLYEGAHLLENGNWLLAGRWVIAGGRQIPLDDGRSVPVPDGVVGLPLNHDPAGLVAWKGDGSLVRFAAGSTRSVSLGNPVPTGTAGGGTLPPVQVLQAGPWLLLEIGQPQDGIQVNGVPLKP